MSSPLCWPNSDYCMHSHPLWMTLQMSPALYTQEHKFTVCILTDLHDWSDLCCICRWYRQDDLLDIVFLDAFLDTVPITDNLDSLNISSDLIRIIVYDTDNLLIQIFTVLDLCDQTSSGLSSADDHDFLSL